MPKSDEPGSTRVTQDPAPDNGAPVQDPAPAARLEDPFLAAFAAARGTVSPELDLSADVGEPAAAERTGDARRLRPGA
ncbi:hypothetical protein EV658_1513 [Phaeovulum veldkampii DSM 11550]|nr:hypothetical protein EV658_1513 [Phaeovulum veldkampii DSM 11550]